MNDLIAAALSVERLLREAQAERNRVVKAANELVSTLEWIGVERVGRQFGVGTASVLNDRVRAVKDATGPHT